LIISRFVTWKACFRPCLNQMASPKSAAAVAVFALLWCMIFGTF
jgi:hypothetical protein